MHTSIRKLVFAATLCCLPFSAALAANADKEVDVTKAFAAESAPTQKMGAVYFDLTNKGKVSHTLVAVLSNIAEEVQIHDTQTIDNQHQMREVREVEVLPGATQSLQPGGKHVMLMNIKHPLKAGEMVAMTLMFEDGSKADIKVPVEKR